MLGIKWRNFHGDWTAADKKLLGAEYQNIKCSVIASGR